MLSQNTLRVLLRFHLHRLHPPLCIYCHRDRLNSLRRDAHPVHASLHICRGEKELRLAEQDHHKCYKINKFNFF